MATTDRRVGFLPPEVFTGPGRVTRAVVDLDAIAENAAHFRRLIGPGTELMAVVKANGYGHGATRVARAALEHGASHLAVATVDEGRALRAAGIDAPVLVLGPIGDAEISEALRSDLALAVADPLFARAVAMTAARLPLDGPASLHLKLDTGMRRFGATADGAVALARAIVAAPGLTLSGVFTHFAAADDPDSDLTDRQDALLDTVLDDLDRAGIPAGLVHAANSAAVLRDRRFDRGLVRVGIALYGLAPAAEGVPPGVRPAMSLVSRVARVVDLHADDGVGYGHTYRAGAAERAALVPIGYADGYRRGLSNRAAMGIGGFPAPVRGRVSMDQTVVGLPTGHPVVVGDPVVVVGPPETGAPGWDDLARTMDTIGYELVSGIAPRVPRVYLRRGHVVATDGLFGTEASSGC